MKPTPAIILVFVSSCLCGQSTQYVESYDLQTNPGTKYLTRYVLAAALNGNLATFYLDSGKIVQLTPAEMRKNMVTQWAYSYDDWNPNTDYYTGDRVMHESFTWEVILDSRAKPPQEGDFWKKARNDNSYFLPHDLTMRLHFNWADKTRINQWVHFIGRAEMSLLGVDQYLFSFKYADFEKIVNQTPIIVYQPNAPALGWVNESIFYFEDPNYQDSLLSRLCKFAYQNQKASRVYLSQDSLLIQFKRRNSEITDLFSKYNFPYRTTMELRWKNNSIDSISVSYVVDELAGKYRRIAEVPFKKFLSKITTGKKLKFPGFHTFSTAISNGILKPTDTDTLLNDITPQSTNNSIPAISEVKVFTTSQQVQYSLKLKNNSGFLKEGDEFGKYILNAITSGKFKNQLRAYSNDSLKSEVSDSILQSRIIMAPMVSYPMWDQGGLYVNDDIVKYKDKHYRCAADNRGFTTPDVDTFSWRIEPVENILFGPQHFNKFYLTYQLLLNEKCQITSRYPTAITVYGEDQMTQLYRPIMTLEIETLKKILLDSSVGSSGSKYWDMIEKGRLTGFLHTNSLIRKQ